ncbi:MAG: hypothetical protein AAGA56_11535 [Myxococcota bacterium]
MSIRVGLVRWMALGSVGCGLLAPSDEELIGRSTPGLPEPNPPREPGTSPETTIDTRGSGGETGAAGGPAELSGGGGSGGRAGDGFCETVGRASFCADFDGPAALAPFSMPNDPVTITSDLSASPPRALRAFYDFPTTNGRYQRARTSVTMADATVEVGARLRYASEPTGSGKSGIIPFVLSSGNCAWLFYAETGVMEEQLDNTNTGRGVLTVADPLSVGTWSELQVTLHREASTGRIETLEGQLGNTFVADPACQPSDELRLDLGLYFLTNATADVRIDNVVVRER